MRNITLNAYAKINLSLDVIRLREDGYHDIQSLMQGIDLCDVIKLEHREAPSYSVRLQQNTQDLPLDDSNLAIKAANLMASETELGEIIITLDKRLPVAAGIAGGSGNAAAVMLGINALMGNQMNLEHLMTLGRKIGADVPFSIYMNASRNRELITERDELEGIDEAGVAAMVCGIGEKVGAYNPIHRHIIMMNPAVSVSTAEVYAEIDKLPEDERRAQGLWKNALEAYTLHSVDAAGRLYTAMHKNLHADSIVMSGSGPTIVAYYEDGSIARQDWADIEKWIEPEWKAWISETGKE